MKHIICFMHLQVLFSSFLAPPECLKQLLKFWTGWEMATENLQVEVVNGAFPKSSTCFQSLRLPAHYHDYNEFQMALEACIATCDTGFGLV